MKKIYQSNFTKPILMVLVYSLLFFNSKAQIYNTLTQTFSTGVSSTTAQCNDFQTYRASLTRTDYSIVRLTNGTTTFVCSTAVTVQALADFLRTCSTAPTLTTFIDGANYWYVGTCTGIEIGVLNAAPVQCQCNAAVTNGVLRPCILNNNWGGVGGAPCPPTGQTITLEFGYPSGFNDAGVLSIDSPTVFSLGTKNVKATIKNFGKNIINNVNVNWSVNNVLQTPVAYSSTLDTVGGSGISSAQVTLGTVNLLNNVLYNLKVWTSMPNGVADTTNNNDTLLNSIRSPLSGGYTIGALGDFATITAAAATLRSAGVNGAVNFTLIDDLYSKTTGETFPINFTNIVGSSLTNRITFKPSLTATPWIVDSNSNAIFIFDNSKYVTLDGRRNTADVNRNITIENRSLSGAGMVIKFINDAIGSTMRNCIIRGANNTFNYTSNGGLVYIGGTNRPIPSGNDSISIINNIITRSGNNPFGSGINSTGQSTFALNDNITIDSNLIYGYIGYPGSSYASAISVNGTGNGNNWKIRGNSFYDTASVVLGTGGYAYSYAMYFVPGTLSNGDTISGNFIGGNAPFAPEGVVGNKLQYGPSLSGGYHYGIYTSVGAGSGIVLADNVVRSIRYPTSTNTFYFYPYYLVGGKAQVGYAGHGNMIGSLIDTNSIYLKGTGYTYGIYGGGSSDLTMEDNTIANFTLADGSNYMYGYMLQSSNATGIVNNNRIKNVSLQGANTGVSYLIYVGGSNQNQIISNNIIGGPNLADSISISSLSSGRFYGMYIVGGTNNTVTNNKVQNMFCYYPSSTAGSSASLIGMYNSVPSVVTGNRFNNFRSYGVGTAGLTGIFNAGGASVTYAYDTVSNFTASSTYTSTGSTASINGIDVSGASGLLNINNCQIFNLDNDNTGYQVNGIYCLNSSTSGQTYINNNTIWNLRSKGSVYASGGVVGINNGAATSYPNQVISGNTIHSLVSYNTVAGTPSIVGIISNSSSALVSNTSYVTKNNIHSFNIGLASTNATMYGIWVNSGNSLYANNMIRLGRDTAGALIGTSTIIKGIYQSSSGALQNRYFHNTVYIEAAPTVGTATQITSAFELTTAPTAPGFVNVRNNIFVNNTNNSSGSSVGLHYVVRYPANPSNLIPIPNFTADYNQLDNQTGTNVFVGQVGTNNYALLDTLKSKAFTDGSSGYDNAISFINATGAYDLVNLRLTASNKAEGAGDTSVLAFVTDDIDGNLRSSRTPTDIGASSGLYTSTGDIHAPGITYNRLTNTTITTNRTLLVNIYDKSGVASGGLSPRIYFKKTAVGIWFSNAGTLTSGTVVNGTWSFVIDNSLMSGVTAGDSVYYFIVAQDATVGNLNGNAMYAAGSSVNSLTNYPFLANSYLVSAAFPAIVTVGSGGNYASLTEAGAGGFFNAVNNGSLSGNITAEIISNITESGAVQLNPWIESGAGNYTLTIRPQTNVQRILSGSVANTSGLIRINGANRVNILGYSSTGSNIDTNLVIRASSTSTPALGLLSGTGSDTIANVAFESRVSSSTSGIVFISATPVPTIATTGVNNVLFNGCSFRQDQTSPGASLPYNGIYAVGTVPRFNNNIWIKNCMFYNYTYAGINLSTVGNGNGWQITDNHFYQNALATWTSSMYGIYFTPSNTSDNNIITGNWIGGTAPFTGGNSLVHSGLFYGIYAQAGIAGGTIINSNKISNVSFTSANTNTQYGIYVLGTAGTYTIKNNKIGNEIPARSINSAGNQKIIGIYSSATGNITVQNDTVLNITNTNAGGATVSVLGISVVSGSANTTIIDGNLIKGIYMNSANVGYSYDQSGALTGIFLGSTSLNQSITNNTIQTLINTNATAASEIVGIMQYSGGAVNILNNTIYGISSKSTQTSVGSYQSAVFGINVYSTTSFPQTFSGNVVDSIWHLPTTAATTQVVGIFNYYFSSIPVIMTNNIVRNINTFSSNTGVTYNASLIGIGLYYGYGTINGNISNNKIYNLQNRHTTSAHSIVGLHYSGAASIVGNNSVVNGNFIHSFKSLSTSTPRFDGLVVYAGNSTFTNNMIRLGIDSAGVVTTNPTIMNGIFSQAAYQNNFYNNTILVTGAPTSGSAQTTAMNQTTQIPASYVLNIKNNIFINATNNGGTAIGRNYGLRVLDSLRLVSNYNLFNITGTGGLIAGTNYANYPSLSGSINSWKAVTGLDMMSGAGDPNLNANALGTSDVVDLSVQATTPIEKSGDPTLTTVLTDYYGNLRASNSPSDIGANAGNFTQSPDLFPPMITFAPLTPSGTLSGTRVLSGVNITDNNGIPMTGASRPKIYYSKDGLVWFNSSATSLTGSAFNATASFGIDYTPMLPLTVNDTIRYYVIAQDNAGNTISSAPFAVASDVSTIISHPVNPNKYNFLPVIAANTVFTVGVGQTYTSLTGVGGFFDFINTRTLGGSITAEISSDLTESGAVSLNLFGEDGAGAGTYSLTIKPNAATTSPRVIQGSIGGNGLIKLNGTNRVKITGVPTGGSSTLKYLLFRNQSTAAPAIAIMNGAFANRIHNCIIESGNIGTSGAAGVVSIITLTGTVPCTFDTISNCIIRNDGTAALPSGLPTFSVYSNGLATGTGVFNNSCVITGNEIANFINSGIVMDLNNSSNWAITNNSMYCNLTFTPPTATQLVGINLVPNGNGSGFLISGNYVGGSAANCGGTPWTNTSPSTAFFGIRLSVGQGANTMVQNNTVKNINFTATGSSQFFGIYGLGGNIVIGGGVGLGNTVGDATTTNSIRFGNATTHYGIYYAGTNNSLVSYNTVAGMTMGTLGYSGSFIGIGVAAGNCLGITNNTVGSTTVANSMVNNGYSSFYGINPSLPSNYTLGTYPVSNNTVANLYSAANNFSSTSLTGIYLANSANVLANNNTIFNLSSNSISNSFSGLGAVQGIQSSVGSQTYATIKDNTIYGLRALNTGAFNTCVYGVICAAGQSPVVTGNRIYDLTNASTSTSLIGNVPVIGGIVLAGSPQINATVTNNQVTLGSGVSTNTQINGLWLQYSSSSFTLNAFHNTIFITGTNASLGNQNSYAFARSNNSGAEMIAFVNLRNNIFANNRTGGSGSHFAIANYTNAPTNTYWSLGTSQYNLLASANATTLAQWGNISQTFSTWKLNSTSDAMSYSMTLGTSAGQLNPANLFTSSATGNLSINSANIESWYVYGKAIAGAQVNNLNNDFSGITRGTTQGYANTIGSTQLVSAPSMLPPAAVASALPVANNTSNYMFAERNVATINWGPSVPTSATIYNYTGVTPANQPTGNSLNQYVRAALGSTGTYNYSASLYYDAAMMGAVTAGANLKVSTAVSATTPVWLTNPVSTVNSATQTVTALGLSTTTNNIMLTGTENNVPPTILAFNPTSRQVGGAVTIYGRSFVTIPAVSNISFNGTNQSVFVVVNDTTITTTVPVGATTGTVSITNAYGTGVSAINFVVIQAPTVTSFTPITGTLGSTVTITGTNFSSATQVQVNTTNVVSFTVVNSTTITAIIPTGATSGNITVTNPAGSGNGSLFGSYTVIQAPTITSFTPSSGAAGITVSLTGTNYQSITNVSFNGITASYTVNSSTSISATVPNGATTGTITVTNGSGTGTSLSNFTVVQLPTITGFTPSSGGIGTSVVISGTNFTGATGVNFNGTAATSYTVNSASQITATVATGTSTGSINVITPAGTANSGSSFTVISDLVVSTLTGVSGTYNNVTVTSTGNASLIGNLIVLGNMVVQTGGKFNANGFVVSGVNGFTLNTGATLSIASANGITATGGITGDIQVSGTRTYNSGGTYIYSGTTAQVTGNGLPSSVDSLVINNSNGVSLLSPITVNRKLTLGNGNLVLGANDLTIASTGTITGASALGYVATTDNSSNSGSLKRTVTSAGPSVVFPVGSSTFVGSYNPATISLPTGTTDVVSVRVFSNVLSSGTTGVAVNSHAVNRSWVISEAVAGGSNATVQLQWQDTMELLPFIRTKAAVAYYNGSNWNALAYASFSAAIGTNPYTLTRTGLTTLNGTFIVGDSTTKSTLPVALINFKGAKINNDIVLNWQTVSEINNSHFEVERSLNGKEFITIGNVEGVHNSNSLNKYSFIDKDIILGNEPVYYYRLKQVDFDGKVAYFGPVAVQLNQPLAELVITTYPNPFTNNVQLNIANNNAGNVSIIIVNMQGKVITQNEISIDKGSSNISIENLEGLANGVYFMNVTINGTVYRQKLVKTNN